MGKGIPCFLGGEDLCACLELGMPCWASMIASWWDRWGLARRGFAAPPSQIFLEVYLLYNVVLGFPGGTVVKIPPAMQETQVQSLGQKDALEEGMATHSSILAWRIPQTEEPGRLQSIGSQRVGHD